MNDDLSIAVDRLAGVRALVVGDAMLDRYIVGAVNRISPEAPVPILLVEREFERLGGAANVAGNVAALGGYARLVALAGRSRGKHEARHDAGHEEPDNFDDLWIEPAPLSLPPPKPALKSKTQLRRRADPEAARLALRCAASDVEATLLPLLPCTIVKTRILANRQQMLRVDREHLIGRTPEEAARAAAAGHLIGPAPLDAAGRAERAEAIKPLLSDCDVILVSDYAKGMVDAGLMAQLAEGGKPVVVDPRPANAELYRGVFLVTPNRREAMEMIGADPRGSVTPPELALRVADRYATRALVTLGAQGMCLADGAGPVEWLPARTREVFDVTGAGDTVAATMAMAIGAGLPLGIGMRLANAAAQWVIGRVGTASVSPAQLKAALAEHTG